MECNLHKSFDPIMWIRYTKPGLLATLTEPSYKASFSQVGIQLLQRARQGGPQQNFGFDALH